MLDTKASEGVETCQGIEEKSGDAGTFKKPMDR
jgi:hypothetical protein